MLVLTCSIPIYDILIQYHQISTNIPRKKKEEKKHHAHSWWKHINVPFIKNYHTSSNTIQYHQEYAHSWSHPHSWWKHGHRWFPNEQFATSTSNLPVFQGQITIKSLSVWIFDGFLSPFYPHGKLTCINHPHMLEKKTLDDGWPESVEEQGLLLLVWRRNIRNDIWKLCYRQSRRGVSRQNSEKCKTIVCIANTFTHRRFYTKLLPTEAFTHRSFYTQKLLPTEAFTHRSFYIQKLLHTEAFTYRSFYTQTLLHRHFYTQKPLHTGAAFTYKRLYTQKLLHIDAFTHRHLYTQTLLHKHFYTQTLLHADAFTQRSLYTQTLLHTDGFTYKDFYAETLLHTDAFTHRRFYTQALLHTITCTHRRFYTQAGPCTHSEVIVVVATSAIRRGGAAKSYFHVTRNQHPWTCHEGYVLWGPPTKVVCHLPKKKYKRADLAGGDRFWAGTHSITIWYKLVLFGFRVLTPDCDWNGNSYLNTHTSISRY